MIKCMTGSLEDYLEVIYIIHKSGKEAGVTDIAKFLSFSKASVNRAINVLKLEGMALQEKYGKIILTEKGKKIAQQVYKKHVILRDFFKEILSVSANVAEIDACKAEHVLSSETLKKMETFLNMHRASGGKNEK